MEIRRSKGLLHQRSFRKKITGLDITSGLDAVKKVYTTGDSFDSTGLVVTATYEDTSTADVTSSVVWSPDPLTEGTTSVTGTLGGFNVIIDGLTVNPYDNTFNIESGAQYRISQNGYYLKSNGTSGTPKGVTDENDATIFTFTLVGNDTFEIKDGTNYLYTNSTTGTNIRVGSTADSWKIMEVTISSNKYVVMESTKYKHYLTYYSTNTDFRNYENTNSIKASTIFEKYVEPSFTITGAPTENIEIGASGTLGVSVEGLTITWSTSDSNVVDIDQSGTYLAYDGGVAVITATDSEGAKVRAQIVVNYGEITIAKANTLCKSLSSGATSDYKITLKDTYITKIDNTQKIYLSDNVVGTSGSNSILLFDYTKLVDLSKSALLNGRITVTGNLLNYRGTTYEITNPEFTYTDTAITFAQDFNYLLSEICTTEKMNDDNSNELAIAWEMLIKEYASVETTYAKPKLKEATTEDTNADIAKMIGLYDHIVKRYGNKLGDNYNFIGRNVLSSSLSNITYRIQDNNTIILVVVLVAFTSVTIIGGYMMIRKRKEN